MIYLQLFWSFLQVGMFSIGGGYAAMPLIQAQVVDKYQWLTMGEFTDLVTIAEMTPGPITINSATFVGIRIGGVPGAAVATLGSIFPALIIVTILAVVYYKYKGLDLLRSILASLRPAVVALIASAGLTILIQVVFGGEGIAWGNVNWIGVVLFAGAFFVMRKFKKSPILVMLSCGVLGLAVGAIAG